MEMSNKEILDRIENSSLYKKYVDHILSGRIDNPSCRTLLYYVQAIKIIQQIAGEEKKNISLEILLNTYREINSTFLHQVLLKEGLYCDGEILPQTDGNNSSLDT